MYKGHPVKSRFCQENLETRVIKFSNYSKVNNIFLHLVAEFARISRFSVLEQCQSGIGKLIPVSHVNN